MGSLSDFPYRDYPGGVDGDNWLPCGLLSVWKT